MTIIFHSCVECGEYTPENEARYLGENERELWLCPSCDAAKKAWDKVEMTRPLWYNLFTGPDRTAVIRDNRARGAGAKKI